VRLLHFGAALSRVARISSRLVFQDAPVLSKQFVYLVIGAQDRPLIAVTVGCSLMRAHGGEVIPGRWSKLLSEYRLHGSPTVPGFC
jgi:hypothetical protein